MGGTQDCKGTKPHTYRAEVPSGFKSKEPDEKAFFFPFYMSMQNMHTCTRTHTTLTHA